jgi:beta-lactamase regulating signal transducer with metallopeptidase domain
MNLDLVLRTSALLLGATLMAQMMGRSSAAARHLVWHLSIVGVLAAPILSPLAPAFSVPLVGRVPEVRTVPKVPGWVPWVPSVLTSDVPSQRTVGTSGTLGTLGTPLGTNPGTLGTVRTIGTVGAVAALLWFVAGWLMSGWHVRRSRPAPAVWVSDTRALCARMGIAGPIELREAWRECSPHVAGLFQSVILLPPSAASWPPEDRQAALVHELTHIKRADRRTQALAQLACALYWFNPLVWHAAASLARERERACDDEVLRMGAKPSAYAALLLDMARAAGTRWLPSTALSMARPSALEGRLLTILSTTEPTNRRASPWIAAVGVTVITAVVLGAQPSAQPSTGLAAPPTRAAAPDLMDLPERPPSSTDMFVRALADDNAQVREQAAIGLAFTPGAAVIDPLLSALRDPDAQVREKAAIGLAFRRDPRVVEPLLWALSDPDAQVREKAAIALGTSGDSRATEALKKAASDPDARVREKALAGLVLMGLRP